MTTINELKESECIQNLYFKYRYHETMVKLLEKEIKEKCGKEQDDFIHDMETQGFI